MLSFPYLLGLYNSLFLLIPAARSNRQFFSDDVYDQFLWPLASDIFYKSNPNFKSLQVGTNIYSPLQINVFWLVGLVTSTEHLHCFTFYH